jgi:hypothetical protein
MFAEGCSLASESKEGRISSDKVSPAFRILVG